MEATPPPKPAVKKPKQLSSPLLKIFAVAAHSYALVIKRSKDTKSLLEM